jgi:hypothetical protein
VAAAVQGLNRAATGYLRGMNDDDDRRLAGEVADESADAPETVAPDTSLGREGGRRYRRPGNRDE